MSYRKDGCRVFHTRGLAMLKLVCQFEHVLMRCYRDVVAAIDRRQSFQANRLYYVVSTMW